MDPSIVRSIEHFINESTNNQSIYSFGSHLINYLTIQSINQQMNQSIIHTIYNSVNQGK